MHLLWEGVLMKTLYVTSQHYFTYTHTFILSPSQVTGEVWGAETRPAQVTQPHYAYIPYEVKEKRREYLMRKEEKKDMF